MAETKTNATKPKSVKTKKKIPHVNDEEKIMCGSIPENEQENAKEPVTSQVINEEKDDFDWEEDTPPKIIPKQPVKEKSPSVVTGIDYGFGKSFTGTVEETVEPKQTKNQHIQNAKVGQFVAFKNVDGKVFSAKIIEKLEGKFKVETRNGSVYFVDHVNVMWIKTSEKWPPGIYNAMRESSKRR